MKKPTVSIVAALGSKTRAIGKDNQLLWHIPADMKRFKAITSGHPVIMGRKTFESILALLGKPLPERLNIVVTRQGNYDGKGVVVSPSVAAAIKEASEADSSEIFVIGGQQIYKQALPSVDRLYLTLIDSDKNGDTWFPSYEHTFIQEIKKEQYTYGQLHYTWLTLERGS